MVWQTLASKLHHMAGASPLPSFPAPNGQHIVALSDVSSTPAAQDLALETCWKLHQARMEPGCPAVDPVRPDYAGSCTSRFRVFSAIFMVTHIARVRINRVKLPTPEVEDGRGDAGWDG